MNIEQKKKLVEAVEESIAWERIQTNVEGIFIVKTPTQKNNQNVFVELNPSVNGQPVKKRGIYLKNKNELKAFINLLTNPKVEEVINVINEYYGKQKASKIEI